jgi:uridine kinase
LFALVATLAGSRRADLWPANPDRAGEYVAQGLVIGICGGTGSGKTTVTERIISALSQESVLVLQQDHYYRDLPHLPLEERARQNFDHPDSLDTPLLTEHVRQLRKGCAIERPTYDFARHEREAHALRLAPRLAIIVEGHPYF